MKRNILLIATFLGGASVILGAFGAHAFKKILDADKLTSFETGVKYQMYSALLLLILGLFLKFDNKLEKSAGLCLITGTLFFSGSVYLLAFAEHWGVNFGWMWPITPFGGMLMIVGWGMLFARFLKMK